MSRRLKGGLLMALCLTLLVAISTAAVLLAAPVVLLLAPLVFAAQHVSDRRYRDGQIDACEAIEAEERRRIEEAHRAAHEAELQIVEWLRQQAAMQATVVPGPKGGEWS